MNCKGLNCKRYGHSRKVFSVCHEGAERIFQNNAVTMSVSRPRLCRVLLECQKNIVACLS
jgi:hypothetical protein